MAERASDGRSRLADRVVRAWPRIDAALFPVFTGVVILYAARTFYGSLLRQTHGVWSAPLDDVFIHFDYARATARGYPFQWSEGNGFSSGNTSLTYPFVLALGYLVGFRGPSLMVWAAIVACASMMAFFLAVRRMTDPLGRWAKYLVPPAVLSLGALNWSLWSGMENALHLGVWGLVVVTTYGVTEAARDAPSAVPGRAWLAGAAGALLFATRPESVVCVAALAAFAAWEVRAAGLGGFGTLVRMGVPGALAVAAQAAANRVFTGEWTANGAISKLGINDPYMPNAEKWNEYLFLLKYVVVRNTHHHFAETGEGELGWGAMIPAVGLLPLLSRRTRKPALVLWTSALGWLALVAMNRQVRWQNERYTMAAVAWVLVLFALGLGVLASRVYPAIVARWLGAREPGVAFAKVGYLVAIVELWARAQLPQMKDQIWFFGRASRNINDQHIVAGQALASLAPRRVLVGDAGALIYASDVPGLDLIGLGGYHDLPFARAAVHGLGASLELIERLDPTERPDVMAIYPSWWGDLPTLFGHRLGGVSVFGNVICGDAEKVIYRADWSTMERGGKPRLVLPSERVVDELDVADLVSEKAHGYVFPHPAMGFVDFRVLADPMRPDRDLFDAGRVIPAGQSERARVRLPQDGGRIIVRTVAGERGGVEVRVDGKVVGNLALEPSKGWIEPTLDLPAGLPKHGELTLTALGSTWLDAHVWIVEPSARR